MGLRLQIVSRQRQSLGERGIKDFGQAGGTIGRSLESDWVLPDGQRFLSSRHASIDFRSGSYYIIDTSTNGVYINDSEDPVGRGNPQRLFSGDRIRIGDYEIVADVDEVENTQETLASTRHVDPVDVKLRVDSPEPTGMDLVDPYEITGVGIESLLEEDEAETLSPLSYKFKTDELELEPDDHSQPPAASAPPSLKRSTSSSSAANGSRNESRAGTPAKKRSTAKGSSTPRSSSTADKAGRADAERAPTAAASRANGHGGTASLDAFFEGAGVEPRRLTGADADRTLHMIGQLMRELLIGMTESLQLRAVQKARVRQSNTIIQPSENNALKFCASADEALNHLLFQDTDAYLGPVDSVRGAFADVHAHQRAVMKGMRSAVGNLLEQLEPEQLEDRFSNGKRGSIMGAASKLKYWDLYRDLYAVISQNSGSELPQAFVEEFARAYEEEVARVTASEKLAKEAQDARKAG